MIEPRITSMRFSSVPVRTKPKAGDLRETKKHGKQVRVHERVSSGPYRGAILRNGSGYCWSWVSYEEARKTGNAHLVPKVDAQ